MYDVGALERSDLRLPWVVLELLSGLMSGTSGVRLAEVRPELPAGIGAVLERTLAVTPAQRFRDAAELRDAFRIALAATGPTAASSGVRERASAWATRRGGVLRSGPYAGVFSNSGSSCAPISARSVAVSSSVSSWAYCGKSVGVRRR